MTDTIAAWTTCLIALVWIATGTLKHARRQVAAKHLREVYGPRVAYPLPAVDAPEADFDDWSRQVLGLRRFESQPVPFRESESFAHIAAVLARNEAARTDWDHWADYFGTDGAA
ncbi:MAG: hypothetical protein ACXVXW_04850 [Mycobacteriaceae bacterium]